MMRLAVSTSWCARVSFECHEAAKREVESEIPVVYLK